ncbi:ParA family protein [Paenarthrobacter histidinolovorans]|uniref:Chromosome partitioning protein n=1 Tax=Paenarthrobacter histidinolovorans TaxID=43664 RepID=A0ABW8MZH6_9MICC
MSPKITAVGNRKGGVGKSSMTGSLAWSLALRGRRVLVLDMDPQGNLSKWMLNDIPDRTMFDVLYADKPGILGEAAVPSLFPGVWIVPAEESLARIEVEALVAPEMRLKSAAHGSASLSDFDDVLIDMPPALGRLTLNGLIAADAVIAVTTPEAFSVQGLVAFLETVELVRGRPHLNPNLRMDGVMVNQFDATAEHTYQLGQIREAYPNLVLSPVIPKRTAMRDAVSAQIPLTKVGSRGAAELQDTLIEFVMKNWEVN